MSAYVGAPNDSPATFSITEVLAMMRRIGLPVPVFAFLLLLNVLGIFFEIAGIGTNTKSHRSEPIRPIAQSDFRPATLENALAALMVPADLCTLGSG
jgi:hypothetical protein